MKKFLGIVLGGIFWLLNGCGVLPNSDTPYVPNEDAPRGQILAQGSLLSYQGKPVGGIAVIYRVSNGYVLRVEGFSAPDEANLQLQVTANSNRIATFPIKAKSGNQNYYFSGDLGTPQWNSVSLYSPSNRTDYGRALLQVSGSGSRHSEKYSKIVKILKITKKLDQRLSIDFKEQTSRYCIRSTLFDFELL